MSGVCKQQQHINPSCSTSSSAAVQADLHGVVPVNEAVFGKLEQTAFRWGSRLRQMFAVCHSLNMVSRSTVAGADLERKLFKAVEASFLVEPS